MMEKSILQSERFEGYKDGFSQASQASYDDAYNKGFVEAQQRERKNAARWGWFCFLCGIGLSALIYGFREYLP